MNHVAQWIETEFEGIDLGDQRRNTRVRKMVTRMAKRPGDSLPKQMNGWKTLKGAYRLLDNERVSHEKLSQPHWQLTRKRAGKAGKMVLMVQDITELDYTERVGTRGLGPIGNHQGRGLMVHNSLAVAAEDAQVLGLAYQQVWQREEESYRQKETRSQRQRRVGKQSARWGTAVAAIGKPPEGVRWVHVTDREGDVFSFLRQVQENESDFCIRVVQNRRLAQWRDEEPRYLVTQLRQLSAKGNRKLRIPARRGQAKRIAHLNVSWSQVTLRSPRNQPGPEMLITAWAIRTWEPQPSPDADESLEWLLLTSVAVESLDDALERIEWYTYRWLVEEYHSCLKTGCVIEKSQLRHGQRLQRLLALVAVIAVRLLQLRDLSRYKPHWLARKVVDPLLVQIMAAHVFLDPNTMTLHQFWYEVARLGGFPGRVSDGQPGWKRLWHGWLRLLDWAEGVRLAQNLPALQIVGNP